METPWLTQEIDQLCRVCLQELPKEHQECVSIDNFLNGHENVSYSDAFTKVTGNIVLAHEPQRMCKQCGEMVKIAFDLRETAEKSQIILNDIQPKIDVSLVKVEIDVPKHEEESDIEEDNTENVVNIKHSEKEYQLKYHGDSDPEYNPFSSKCKICGEWFKNEASVKAHKKDQHPDETHPFECPYCNKRISTEKKYDSHQVNCSKRPKKVEGCAEEKSQKFVCPICGLLASKDHMKTHTDSPFKKQENQSLICDICGTRASSRSSMTNHMRVQHLHILFQCKYCPRSFKNPSTRQRHVRQSHRDKSKMIKCRFCDFTSYRDTEIRRHRLIHGVVKMVKCQICYAEFPNKTKLELHMATHSDDRPFICDICGSAFKTKRAVYVHKKTHRAYDYECPVCQRAYLTNQLMRNHAEKNHPEYQLPPPGTIFSKSFLMKKQEQQLKDLASSKGLATEDLPAQELQPMQIYQPFF